MIEPRLADALSAAGRTADELLVASDYDGTLSPLVADPSQAVPDRHALDTLAELGSMPGVHAAIISGRSRSMLAELTAAPDSVSLIGTHGAEGLDEVPPADPNAVAALVAGFVDVRNAFEGTLLEPKPAGAALHYRHAHDQAGAASAARRAANRLGARVVEGKLVVEALIGTMDKGRAFTILRNRWAADQTVFFGDDVTDEDVFGAMTGRDVSVKVGPEPTSARFRVDDPKAVAACLEILVSARRLR